MTGCKTFNTLRRSGQTNLKTCPYNRCCDGKECALLRTNLGLELSEDREQERKMLEWQIGRERRN